MHKKHTSSRKQSQDNAAPQELRNEIFQIRRLMDSVYNHFEQETDPTLIDCHIYELKAAQLRYQFLLKHFKQLET